MKKIQPNIKKIAHAVASTGIAISMALAGTGVAQADTQQPAVAVMAHADADRLVKKFSVPTVYQADARLLGSEMTLIADSPSNNAVWVQYSGLVQPQRSLNGHEILSVSVESQGVVIGKVQLLRLGPGARNVELTGVTSVTKRVQLLGPFTAADVTAIVPHIEN